MATQQLTDKRPMPKQSYAGSLQSSSLVYAKPRQVTVNIPLPSDLLHPVPSNSKKHQYRPLQTYVNNRIRTSKYTLLTFLPKNLFEQFRRVANSFFLLLVVLQAFPLFMTVPIYIAAFPIVFIVLLTSFKDAFEDYKRWKVDKIVNNRTCKCLPYPFKNWNQQESQGSSWSKPFDALLNHIRKKLTLPSSVPQVTVTGHQDAQWTPYKWKDIKVGDIVFLENDQDIPADIIVLSTSEPDCIAYIETKNLDGETNLKLRQGPVETSYIQSALDCVNKLRCMIESESPTTNMLRYQATMTLYPQSMALEEVSVTLERGHKARTEMMGQLAPSVHSTLSIKKIPIDTNGIVLRGTILRNTRWLIGMVVFTGDDTKQIMNSGKTPSKRSKVEKLMNPHVSLNLFFMLALCLFCAIAYGLWESQFTSDSSKVQYLQGLLDGTPALNGFVNFWSCLILFQNIVPISLYISVEIVKTIGAFFIYSDLDMYHAASDTACNPRSWNLADNLGQIEYIFSDKTGTLTRNIMAFKKVCIDGIVYDGRTKMGSQDSQSPLSINTGVRPGQAGHGKRLSTSQISFKSAWIEGVRESQGQREANKSMGKLPSASTASGSPTKYGHTRQSSYASQSSANSRNKNHTEVKIDEPALSETQEDSSAAWVDEAIEAHLTMPEFIGTLHSVIIKDFFTLLSVCHTVLVDDRSDKDSQSQLVVENTNLEKPKTISYKAQSPDEACLVTTAAENGFIFKGREHNQKTQENEIIVELLGKEERYALLNILEFDSDRKRMSVIVRCPPTLASNIETSSTQQVKGDVIVFCKGADNVIFDRLAQGQSQMIARTSKHLEDFAQDGLRTLCLAYRKVPLDYYESWAIRYHDAQTQVFPDPSQRSKSLEALNNEMERQLVLLGATAIEDKLQEGVPECITTLAHAGIKIWVLTGDKIETAINVGFLCGLLKTTETNIDQDEHIQSGMILIEVKNANTDEEICRQLNGANERFWGKGAADQKLAKNEFALIIDGQSLKFALENEEMKALLLDIGCKCKAVVCCRVSPLQKAKVVELVKRGKNVMTLAIGDGANDVSMIQAADVGIGISGEEGLQAAMSADYAIAQFRFLTKLLLVHGRWSYSRISYMILNFYLKSVVFTMVVFWFQFYCGFSASVIYEFTYMLFYNLIFTSLPICILGVFDQDLGTQVLIALPPIYYSEGIKQTFYTQLTFALYLIESIWHSLVCYFIPIFVYGEGPSNSSGLTISSIHLGTVIAVGAIVTVNLSVVLDNHSFSYISHITMWGSCALIFLYTLIYGFIPSSPVLGISPELFPDIQFWLSVLVCVMFSLGPRAVYYFVRRQLFPCDSDILSEVQLLIKNGKMKLSDIAQVPSNVASVEPSRRESMLSSNYPVSPVGMQFDHRNTLQVPDLVRRPSIASLASVTYNMDTGNAAKSTGFSFSHTLGMGAVILRSPLNMLPFKNSPQPKGALSSSSRTSSRISWPQLRVGSFTSAGGSVSKTPVSAPPANNSVAEEPTLQDTNAQQPTNIASKVSIFGRKFSNNVASAPVVRSPLGKLSIQASELPSISDVSSTGGSSSGTTPVSQSQSQRLPDSQFATPNQTVRLSTTLPEHLEIAAEPHERSGDDVEQLPQERQNTSK